VKLLDIGNRQGASAADEIEDAVQRLLLIAQQLYHVFARLVRRAVTEEFGLKPVLDQSLGHATLDLIEVFDHAGFYSPFTA
jgi:hypothetical protein